MTKDRTSVAETSDYPEFCAEAVRDDALFARFRSDPRYCQVVSSVDRATGKSCLDTLLSQTPKLERLIPTFQTSERCGSPQTFDYPPWGRLAGDTLRYAKVLSDLKVLFGNLDGVDITEIGGGYGGQCKIIRDAHRPRSYRILDLPPALALARKYLERLGVEGVHFAAMNELDGLDRPDLVISNFAFSELSRDTQDVYLEKVITRARRGYMILNSIEIGAPHSRAALRAMLPGSVLVAESPFSRFYCQTLVWDSTQTTLRFAARTALFDAHGQWRNLPARLRFTAGRGIRAALRAIGIAKSAR